MDPRTTIWTFTLLLTCLAAVWDLRSRKIPNWITVPGVVAGIALHAFLADAGTRPAEMAPTGSA